MGLGAASAVSLKEARAKRDGLAKLLAQDVNPLTERRRNRARRHGAQDVRRRRSSLHRAANA
jgi:hypothetical protein